MSVDWKLVLNGTASPKYLRAWNLMADRLDDGEWHERNDLVAAAVEDPDNPTFTNSMGAALLRTAWRSEVLLRSPDKDWQEMTKEEKEEPMRYRLNEYDYDEVPRPPVKGISKARVSDDRLARIEEKLDRLLVAVAAR